MVIFWIHGNAIIEQNLILIKTIDLQKNKQEMPYPN